LRLWPLRVDASGRSHEKINDKHFVDAPLFVGGQSFALFVSDAAPPSRPSTASGSRRSSHTSAATSPPSPPPTSGYTFATGCSPTSADLAWLGMA
jgi:hypothetical protein